MLSRISISSTTRSSWAFTAKHSIKRCKSSIPKHNQAILDMLKAELQREKDASTPNRYKILSFGRAVEALSGIPYPIQTMSDVKPVKGIGVGIARRIGEFLTTLPEQNTENLARIEYKNMMIMQELDTVPGIGKSKAQKLVEAGCRGIKDLRKEKYLALLAPSQRVFVRYMEHLAKLVSQQEAETIAEFIRNNLSSKHEVIIVGAHRRGCPNSSAIQILLLHPDHVHVPMPTAKLSELNPQKPRKPPKEYTPVGLKASSPLHKVIIPILKERGLVAAEMFTGLRDWQGVIRMPEKDDNGNWGRRSERLLGIEKMAGSFRRLHLSLVSAKSRGASLVVSTGDAELIKRMRIRAHKHGMYLNELGLWKWYPDPVGNNDVTEAAEDEITASTGFWQLLQGKTEEAIFEQLGMDYVEPERRNLAFVS